MSQTAAETPAVPLDASPLAALPVGGRGVVAGVVAATPAVDPATLRRLGEIGFLPGEPVEVVRRGPGGKEPIAVVIGQTMFALRLLEAQSVRVIPAPAA